MNLNHLHHFLAVAEQGSLRAAAEALGLSQPAISKSLRSLEAALGVTLVQRGARGSSLTAFGNVLYARAKLIGNEVNRVTDELRQMSGAAKGRVRLGASATPSILLLPQAVRAFRAENPEVRLEIIGGMPSVLLPRLMDGSLDLVTGPRPLQPIPDQIGSWPLFRVPCAIAVRRGHPLENAASIKDFVDVEWVLSSSAIHIESSLHAAFLTNDLPAPHIVIRSDSLYASYALIAKTDYAGLIPRYVLEDSLIFNLIALIDVPEFTSIDSIKIFFRGNAPLSVAGTRLAGVLRRHAQFLVNRGYGR